MKKSIRQHWSAYAVVLLFMAALATAGCTVRTNAPPTPANVGGYTVNTMSKTDIGDYLVDSNGKTLYYFAKDTIDTSNAAGVVVDLWPIFYEQNIVVPATLNASDFGTITRADGKKQTTYMGWPLYYYSLDVKAGDTLGEGFGGIWFVIKVPFYTVMIESKADVGNYLVDAKGMTLYHAAFDINGQSNATSAILGLWPPFGESTFIIPSTLHMEDFSTITTDGKVQTTYKGWPLYYFVNDKAPGDTAGQGVKNVWSVTAPDVSTAPSVSAAPVP
jgi:predicted lipoprotein with Yx(FWY)xxD motif